MTVAIADQNRLTDHPSEAPENECALQLRSGKAYSLGQDVDVDCLLAELASGVRQMRDGDRVSVLLLDNADRRSPAGTRASQHDDGLWQSCR